MKKYKLIKKYPGSLKLGTEILSDDNENVENYPEYWEEVIEKNYEILSYFQNSSPHGMFTYDRSHPNWEIIEKQNYKIYSVKRLSDGEVFTVGDNVGGKYTRFIIGNITIGENGNIIAGSKLNPRECHITGKFGILKHIKKPLFITEDGVDIFEGDTYYAYQTTKEKFNSTKNYKIGKIQKVIIKGFPNAVSDIYCGESVVNLKEPTIKRFSTKEAAEEYIKFNKPKFTEKHLIEFAKLSDTFINRKQLDYLYELNKILDGKS